MIPEVTDQNLYLLLPGKVVAAVELACRHHEVDALDALRQFYASSTYRRLEQEPTKLWHYGPVALYEEYQERG